MKRPLIVMSITLLVIMAIALTTVLSFKPVTTEEEALQIAENFIAKHYVQDYSEYILKAYFSDAPTSPRAGLADDDKNAYWVVYHYKDNQLGGGVQLYIDPNTGRVILSFQAK